MIPSRPDQLPIWEGPLPEPAPRSAGTLVLPVPTGNRTLLEPGQAAQYLGQLHEMMRRAFGRSFEILLVPYEEGRPADGHLLGRLAAVTSGLAGFRWLEGSHIGPGSAVRAGVFASRGRTVMVGNLEYYYEPDFFIQALASLRRDRSLTGVRANRRLPDAEFMVPVGLLSMVYRRHLLGMLLTRIWGRLFDIGTSDALSGAYVLRRGFALRAFNRVTCPWFLYGAELAILAKVNDLRLCDIPAHFAMEAEKSRLRLWGEIAKVLTWTSLLVGRIRRGEYRFLQSMGKRLTADDWGLSPGVNEGILRLARTGLLKRVSILAEGRYVSQRLNELKRVKGIEFGLHFNLTCPEAGGTFPSPWRFLLQWVIDRSRSGHGTLGRVRSALQEQLGALRALGIRPVHFDGHHHVHAVPGLLEAVSDILKVHGIRYVRTPYDPTLWVSSRLGVTLLGTLFKGAPGRCSLATSRFLYPTPSDFEDVNRFTDRLDSSPEAEVLVHPAAWDDIAQAAPSDPLRKERVEEYRLLRLLALERSLLSGMESGRGSGWSRLGGRSRSFPFGGWWEGHKQEAIKALNGLPR